VITGLAQTGTTVFLTTQYLEEADRMADWIAVLDAGRVIAEGTPERLKERVAAQRLDITAASSDAFAAITRVLGHRIIQSDPSRLTIGAASDGTARQVRDLLDELDPERRAVSRFTVHTPTLDDVFLCLTGHGASAAPHTAGRGEDVRRER
jgi:ABC-2 type transport system ATP-binding protein